MCALTVNFIDKIIFTGFPTAGQQVVGIVVVVVGDLWTKLQNCRISSQRQLKQARSESRSVVETVWYIQVPIDGADGTNY